MTKTIPQAFIRKYEPTCNLHLPDFWASAIINNDQSGLEDEDIQELNDFIEYWEDDIYIDRADIPSDENGCIETHFMKYHDASHLGVLACDCFEYIFTYKPTSSLFNS
tara:strand:+ start:522 stop:845 length:324 start_codon:yes stop_codon:yes gene_type:complete